jgi:hypothetical protein
VSDLDALLEGAPEQISLPDELKADQNFPKQFDLVALQSPVKSQGSRGVCSIFSTVALMEHLYMKEGAVSPDFSEQHLQWSVKSELGRFKHTSGSNGSANIEAISRFGVVEESVMPYESSPWSAADDPACAKKSDEDEEETPTFCFTNGDPSEEVMSAPRFKLPYGSRWVSSRVNNIKAFLYENESAVVAGMTFFYQSWNHGRSELPVSSAYKTAGYVLYPTAKDKELSEAKRAGHSILIVGWDDELEVPVRDENGKPVLDDNGNEVTERGFFLFKNSWGTSAFGTTNPFGAGYGWLSMRYVEEYASVVSARPPNESLVERCDDQLDNNFDGLTDCADVACAEAPSCRVEPSNPEGALSQSLEVGEQVPDNSEEGLVSALTMSAEGVIESLTLTAEITHSYRGDLTLTLTSPEGQTLTLWDREGRNAEDLSLELELPNFAGAQLKGEWLLHVYDTAEGDVGTLERWGLKATIKD